MKNRRIEGKRTKHGRNKPEAGRSNGGTKEEDETRIDRSKTPIHLVNKTAKGRRRRNRRGKSTAAERKPEREERDADNVGAWGEKNRMEEEETEGGPTTAITPSISD